MAEAGDRRAYIFHKFYQADLQAAISIATQLFILKLTQAIKKRPSKLFITGPLW